MSGVPKPSELAADDPSLLPGVPGDIRRLILTTERLLPLVTHLPGPAGSSREWWCVAVRGTARELLPTLWAGGFRRAARRSRASLWLRPVQPGD